MSPASPTGRTSTKPLTPSDVMQMERRRSGKRMSWTSPRSDGSGGDGESADGEMIDDIFESTDFEPLKLFTEEQIAGRVVKLFNIKKIGPLGLGLEGGLGSDRNAQILVTEVSVIEGSIPLHSVITRGDQIMMVDGIPLMNVTLGEAQTTLMTAVASPLEYIKLIVALGSRALDDIDEEDSITYL